MTDPLNRSEWLTRKLDESFEDELLSRVAECSADQIRAQRKQIIRGHLQRKARREAMETDALTKVQIQAKLNEALEQEKAGEGTEWKPGELRAEMQDIFDRYRPREDVA